MSEKQNLAERFGDYRPSKTMWFWSCVAFVVATIVIGFAWGGWVTGGTATRMAKDAGNTAQAKLTAAICVNEFENEKDTAAKLASLKKTDTWERESFIEKGGWVTPPGIKEPVSGAAELCVQQLMNAKLPAVKAAVSG
jgi:hypothetical protein